MKYSDYVALLAMLFGSVATCADAAEFLRADLALIQCDTRSSQPRWMEGGAFSEMLQRENQERLNVFLTGRKNAIVRYDLKHDGRKKDKLRLTPRIFIKPVLIIEELQTFVRAYQTRETVSVGGYAQAKAIIPPAVPVRAKPVAASARVFSFMPYYHKVFGIYLQIIW
ncbi:hypothetical protein U14_04290 [Candidatus Moduliflexus flocculans]|uniref:Uncharacterized protein n=1 Tax=Candidatus Moduliflexus flocculans TaxID=1499966 RepID=A0A0S6W0A6_9BACT|nr:hypothetical protein U14_04290 [Candidatus Moduliflexus flocculans]